MADSAPPSNGRRRRSQRKPPGVRRVARGSGKGRLRWVLAMGLVLGAAPVALLLFWATRGGPGDGPVVTTRFAGGESAEEAAVRLAELGLVQSPRLFALYFGWFAPGVEVQPGTHLLRLGLTPRELVQRLGRLPSRRTARVTLPEGYTYLQIAERLEAREICSAAEFRTAASDPELLLELAVPGKTAEGFLFPATYELFVNSTPAETVRRMVGEARQRIARVDARLGGPLSRLGHERGWTEREVVTLASIIEKEARVPEERPVIASVFFNRLSDPSFRPARTLQSDATAAYGCLAVPDAAPSCANYRGRVTPEMLRDPANPYNTYRHPGLPRGPIGNPGEGALEAVLAPAKTDYLFFVADGRGRHRFSRTFEEHRRAVTAK